MNTIPNRFKLFDVFVGLFVALLLISNVMAQKLFNFYDVTFTAGILVFPLSYILGDVLTEVYGYEKARRVIWIGFAANILAVVFFQISIWVPAAVGWEFQQQYASTLEAVPRTVAASLAGYWAGEFSNSFVLSKIKIITKGKFLFLRTIGSTLCGQALDTVLFVVIIFYGKLPWSVMLTVAASGYAFKVLYEVLVTPLTYLAVSWVKKVEGIDTFDKDVDFSPFRFS